MTIPNPAEAPAPLLALLDAQWSTLGVDEVDVELSPELDLGKRFLRVNLHGHVKTGLDANLSPHQTSVVHAAIAKRTHAELLKSFPWRHRSDARPWAPLDAAEHPLAAAMISSGEIHPHAPSVIHCVAKHTKHVFFPLDQAPDEILARLRQAADLLHDMHGQRPNEEHHRAVDAHPEVPIEAICGRHDWALLFRRPL